MSAAISLCVIAASTRPSGVPIVCGVGHESDVTIADFVADLRAPTPSAAAEAAVRSSTEVRSELRKFSLRISGAARSVVRMNADRLRHLQRDVIAASEAQIQSRTAAVQAVAAGL